MRKKFHLVSDLNTIFVGQGKSYPEVGWITSAQQLYLKE